MIDLFAGIPAPQATSVTPPASDFAQRIITLGEKSAQDAVSPKGAVSEAQVVPATITDPGFGVRPANPNDLNDVKREGIDYANALLAHYNNNEAIAAAAYNAGPGIVNDWLNGTNNSGKNPNHLHLDRATFAQNIPFPETKAYVARVTGETAPSAAAASAVPDLFADVGKKPQFPNLFAGINVPPQDVPLPEGAKKLQAQVTPLGNSPLATSSATAPMRIGEAALAGAEQGFGNEPFGLSNEDRESIAKTGMIATPEAEQSGKATLLQTLNAGLLDTATKAGQLFMRGGSAAISGLSGAVRQAGAEYGAPELGDTLAQMIEWGATTGAPEITSGTHGVAKVADESVIPNTASSERAAAPQRGESITPATPPIKAEDIAPGDATSPIGAMAAQGRATIRQAMEQQQSGAAALSADEGAAQSSLPSPPAQTPPYIKTEPSGSASVPAEQEVPSEQPHAVSQQSETPASSQQAQERAPIVPQSQEPQMTGSVSTDMSVPEPSVPQPEAQPMSALPITAPRDLAGALHDVTVARSPAPEATSLFGTIKALGGIKLKNANGSDVFGAPEVKAVLQDVKYPGLINNRDGRSPDMMREALAERGWFGGVRDTSQTDLNDFYNLLADEAQGSKVYHPESPIHQEMAYRALLDREFADAGITAGDSKLTAARKLAEFRASQAGQAFLDREEAQVDHELGALPTAYQEVLSSHGYEPGSDFGAELEAPDENRSSQELPVGQSVVGGQEHRAQGADETASPSEADRNGATPAQLEEPRFSSRTPEQGLETIRSYFDRPVGRDAAPIHVVIDAKGNPVDWMTGRLSSAERSARYYPEDHAIVQLTAGKLRLAGGDVRKALREAPIEVAPHGFRVEVGAEGLPQTIIPGAERISDKALAERQMAEKKRATTGQKNTEGLGLFDENARPDAQRGLFDEPKFALSPHPSRKLGIPREADPPIASYTDEAAMKSNPNYRAAKAGDIGSAISLVRDIVRPETIAEAQHRFGSDVTYVPVRAQEAAGRNKIPVALAEFYAHETGAEVARGINQTNQVFHTGARPMERLLERPQFAGPVEPGKRYVLVDDVGVMGGSLAELADHIRREGGEVAGVVTLVNRSRSGIYTTNPARARMLEARFGNEIRQHFGAEPSALTADESQYLANFKDADALRASIARSRDERSQRLRAKGIQPPEGETPKSLTSEKPPIEAASSSQGHSVERSIPYTELHFSPEFDAKREVIAADLRDRLNSLGLKDVAVRVPDAIRFDTGAGSATADGVYFRKIVAIALDHNDPIGALDHESIHAMRALNLFTPTEWNILAKRAEREWRQKYNIESRYKGLSEDKLNEEAVAEAFRYYRKDQATKGTFGRIADKVRNTLAAIRNILRGYGFQSSDSIFSKVASGDVGNRARLSDTASVPQFATRTPPEQDNLFKTELPEELPTHAGNINLSRIKSPDDIKALIVETAKKNGDFTEARRGVQSHDETQALADALGMTSNQLLKRKVGKAFNAEEITAARHILAKSANNVFELARKAKNGSDEDLVKFREAWTRHVAIQEQVAGLTAEAGRALSAFRIMADQAHVGTLKRVIESAGGRDRLEKVADLISQLNDPEAINQFTRNAYKPTVKDMLVEAWINALLSGPQTHVVNATSNLLTAMLQVPEMALTATLGALRKPGEKVYFREALARGYAIVQGARDDAIAAAKAFATETPTGGLSKIDQARYKAIPSVILRQDKPKSTIGGVPVPFTGELVLGGRQVRVPGRLLLAGDEFFKAIARRQEIAALAVRQALDEGLRGKALAQRIVGLRENPPEEWQEKAELYAEHQTFTDPLGHVGKAFQSLSNGNIFFKIIMPFTRTPVNILKYAAQRSPFAYLFSDWRDDLMGKNGTIAKDSARARVILGTSIAAATASLAAQGLISGNGPADPQERATLYQTGWQPYSLKIGDTWYSYGRLDPIATLLGTTADAVEIAEKSQTEDASKIATLISGAIANNLLNKTYMSGLSSVVQALQDPVRYGQNWADQMAGTLIPTGVAQFTQHVEDPYLREARGIIDTLKSRTPGLSQTLPPKRDIFGEPIKRSGELGPDILSPITESPETHDPVANEMVRLGIAMPAIPRKMLGIQLTDQQYDELSQFVGQSVKKVLLPVVQSASYQRLNDAAKTLLLQDILDQTRTAAQTAYRESKTNIDLQAAQKRINALKQLEPVQ